MSLHSFRLPTPAFRAAGFVLAAALLAGTALAKEPARGVHSAVLVTGKVQAADSAKGFVLTPAVLEKLPQHSFTTQAPWTKTSQTYTGVLLRDLMAHLGASGTQLMVTALNDYAITIPLEDAQKFDVLVAHRINGQLIPVRDRGPLLVMYPFDASPELQNRRYYERSIWQIKSVNVQ